MESTLKVSTDQGAVALSADAIQEIAESLPGQVRARQIELAVCEFGRIWTYRELFNKIRTCIPMKLFCDRTVNAVAIQDYGKTIPAQALERYVRAKTNAAFTSFWILEPCYQHELPQRDPWLVGLLDQDIRPFNGTTQMIVIAYWD